ncbi:MAG: carboxymuconolactone decarboxylase family protein [Gemmatimonadetes bacterium]|nr:carboxymuconolactone decarboxylase family protein [Gemmatimonadota bacterium]
MSEADLTESRRVLVRLSAAVAAGDQGRLEAALADARTGADALAVEEALLQSYLFVGYPAALAALAAWRRVSGRTAGEPAAQEWDAWRERGERVFSRVYAQQADALRGNVRALHPDMETWMVTEGYGKVLGRPGLPLTEREICIVAILVVAHAPTQLYSHLRGALEVGVEPPAVTAAVEEAAGFASPQAAEVARRTWADLRARRTRGEEA